ncbi:unnamed protein product [Lathyrus oleraceus]
MVLRFLDHQQKRRCYIGDFSLGWILRLPDQNHQSYMSFCSTQTKREAE